MRSHPRQAKRSGPSISNRAGSLLIAAWVTIISLMVAVPSVLAASTQPSTGELWARRYDGGGHADDWATSMVVSPDGSRIYVTGSSQGHNSGPDMATSAYDAATGGRVWTHRYDGQQQDDYPSSIAISADGATVFVTGGGIQFWWQDYDYVTLAYDAATGAKKWVRYYDGGAEWDLATAISVSPDSATVYITGQSQVTVNQMDMVTLAYRADDGAQLWVERFVGGSNATGIDLEASPDGSRVYVTASAFGGPGGYDYTTVAYDGATGVEQWVSRYDFGAGDDIPVMVAVSSDGSSVFVTGESRGKDWSSPDVATVAYDALTGGQSWVSRYAGPGARYDRGNALAVSPDGTIVYVTGLTEVVPTRYDYLTLAYDTATGDQVWTRRYDGPSSSWDTSFAVGVNPDGSRVYVTGESPGTNRKADYATVAYDGTTGARLWIRRYDGPADGSDTAYALAVAPDGSRVYVTGGSEGLSNGSDFATVAYPA